MLTRSYQSHEACVTAVIAFVRTCPVAARNWLWGVVDGGQR